jgi:integrase
MCDKGEAPAAFHPVGERVSIRRRGKRGLYTAEFWHDGQHHRRALKTANKKVATQRAIAIEHELSRGEFVREPRAVNVRDAVQRYLRDCESRGLAPKTIVRYRGELMAWVDFLEKRHAATLQRVTVGLFDDFRAERGRSRKPSTTYHEANVIRGLLNWCVSRKLTARSPLAGCRLSKPRTTQRPAPTLKQVNAILARSSPRLRNLLSIVALTGMRSGELQGLRKRDVDLDAGFLNVQKQVSGPTKTGSSRRIPIHRRIRPILEAQLRADEHELLVTAQPSARYPAGGHYINTKRLNEDFKAAAKHAGFTEFTLHDLRHFFNTHCINERVPERVIRRWMGHADRSMTGRYYDLTDEQSRSSMDKLAFDDDATPAKEVRGEK